ncbi:hypothetical protein DAMA08_041890 [Martiniozyma asiatica (nom. inval.)]|nr:hypothetical protein DAMA08_041890 [Martiniozyma asiatica]
MSDLKAFRKLSGVESYMYWRTVDSHAASFRVGAKYSKEISVESLYKALSHLCYKYNNLSVNIYDDKIKDKTGAGVLQFMDTITLKDVLTIVDDKKENCETQIDKVHNYYFTYGSAEPLWKIILINKKELLFYCDHVPFDGMAAANFHKLLIKNLNNIENIESKDEFIGMESILFDYSKTPENWSLPPDAADIIESKLSFARHLYEMGVMVLPFSLSKWIRYFFSDNKYAHKMDYNPRSLSSPGVDDKAEWVYLPHNRVEKLAQLCRLNNVKISSLLSLLIMIAAKDILKGHDNTLSLATNIRDLIDVDKAVKLCPNFNSEIGCYAGLVHFDLPAIEKVFPDGKIDWDVVKTMHEYLHKYSPRSYELSDIFKTYNVRKILQSKFDYIKKGNSDLLAFFLSNLGDMSIDTKDGDIDIDRMWFDHENNGGIIWINAATAKQGMSLSIRTHVPEWRKLVRSETEKLLYSLTE